MMDILMAALAIGFGSWVAVCDLDAQGTASVLRLLPLTLLGGAIGAGLVLVTITGFAIRSTMPFAMTWWTVLGPGTLLGLLGLAGAAVAIRSLSRAEPEQALGSAR